MRKLVRASFAMSTRKGSLEKRRVGSIFFLLAVVGLALVLGSIVGVYVWGLKQPVPQLQRDRSDNSGNPSNSLSWAGFDTFEFVGENSSTATVAAGSSVHGTITINILKAAPLRFYVDDRGARFNRTGSTLPAGISVSFNMYGNSINPIWFSQERDQADQSLSPLMATTLGETIVQYTIDTASTVPKGAYDIRIICTSFINNGTVSDQGELYDVTLNVQ